MAEMTSQALKGAWPGRLLFPMTLRKKTLLVVTVTLIALVVVLFFGIRSIVIGSVESLEERDVTTQVQRVNEALDNELGKMDLTLRVEATPGKLSNRERYVVQGLEVLEGKFSVKRPEGGGLADFIADLNMNLFLFSYSPDNIRWGRIYDETSQQVTDVLADMPAGLRPHLTSDSPLLRPPPPTDDGAFPSVRGLIMLSDPESQVRIPMLVVSVRILAQEGDGGPIHKDAAMVMGRFLDEDEIRNLAAQTQLDLAVTDFGNVLDPDVRSLAVRSPLSDTTAGQVHVLPRDDDTVEGHTVLSDINGDPALAWRVDIPRDVMKEGRNSMNLLLIALVIVGLVLVVVIALVLDRLVLSRMSSLNQQVSDISMQSSLDDRVEVPGRDELSNLGGAINGMLGEIQTERGRSEDLLLNVLPQPIAERLKAGEAEGEKVIADSFDSVTVLFSDVVGFTKLSARVGAAELVMMLNGVFSAFDQLSDKHGVEKIKTIGDAYMVVGGLPVRSDGHAAAIADMSLDMYSELDRRNAENGTELNIRIGINSGPVVAGVIGSRKFTYDLWGDAVNTAARMESHGIEGRVQVTEATYNLLKDSFDFEDRGIIDVKGKGDMHVYILAGRKAGNGQGTNAEAIKAEADGGDA